jgi:PAS domain S-box-containing protein
MEFQLRRADGVFGTFLNRVMPLKDAAGRVTRWFGTNTDISERKQTELRLKAHAQELSVSSQSLEAQTRVFKLVLDSMGEGLIAADGEGRFIIWNEAARQQMGRDAADLPGEQWRDFYKVFLPDGVTPYPPESLPLLRALRGESVRVELMVEQPDHAEGVFLEVTARPMKDAEGDLCGGVAVLRDITERKHSDARLARLAEELSGRASELAASRQSLETESLMLQSVLNSMSEGLVAADETGKFILWNPAAARIVGLGGTNVPPGEWGSYYGTYLPDTITPFPMDQNPLVRAIRGEVCSAEIFIRNPELEHGVWIESNGAPLRAKNGVLRGGVVAFRDITQRRADELEIRKLNEELEERVLLRTAELATANQELEAFAYSVSHDLRAPLRHIGGFSKILIEDFGPTLAPEAVRHLERIEEGTRRMGMLVDELLNLAQVGRHALKLQSTPLNSLIEEVISLLQPEVQGRVVTWKVAELPAAECDPVLTKQIFQNLIANALKFTRPRERAVIEIGIVPEGGQMAVFVRDNGVGFDMKYSDKLFGVFQRLHRIEDFEGTGVGLATVQRIVHKHGGRVWAEAELDKGAAFFFTLEPVKGSHLKAEEVLRSEAKALNTKETGSKAAAAAGDGK